MKTPSVPHAGSEVIVPRQSVVSRYDLDFYGRPRILSTWEIVAHELARPILLGVALGFGLAISLLYANPFSPRQAEQFTRASALVELPENEP
jgi:hypothetical protein